MRLSYFECFNININISAGINYHNRNGLFCVDWTVYVFIGRRDWEFHGGIGRVGARRVGRTEIRLGDSLKFDLISVGHGKRYQIIDF